MTRLPKGRASGRTLAYTALVLLFGAAGCDEESLLPHDQPWTEDIPVAELEPGIHAILTFPEMQLDGGPTVAELHLVASDVTEVIGSFQGVLRWDTDVVTLTSATPTEAAMTFWNEVGPGQGRFAGAAANGIRPGPVLRFEMTVDRSLAADAFSLTMEELVAPRSFTNITAQFVQEPNVKLARSLVGGVR